MDAFSYLSVLISIILGLGITQLLTGLGRLMQVRRRTRLYGPAVAWVALLLWAGAIATRSDRYHRFLAPFTGAVFAVYVVLLFTRLR